MPTRDNLPNALQRWLPHVLPLRTCRTLPPASEHRARPSTCQKYGCPTPQPADRRLRKTSAPAVDESQLAAAEQHCYLLYTIKNYTQAHHPCRPIADNGDAKAQHHMAAWSARAATSRRFCLGTRSAGQQTLHPGNWCFGQLLSSGPGTAVDKAKPCN